MNQTKQIEVVLAMFEERYVPEANEKLESNIFIEQDQVVEESIMM